MTGFITQFSDFGREPSVDRYLALFHPDGSVLHPGMAAPASGEVLRAFITNALSAMPDFRLTPVRWAARGDDVFVEALSSGSRNGQRCRWPATYCVTLRDGRVIRGRAYYDRAAVLTADRRAERSELQTTPSTATEEPLQGGLDELAFLDIYRSAHKEGSRRRLAALLATDATLVLPDGRRGVSGYIDGEISPLPWTAWTPIFEARATAPGLAFLEWRRSGVLRGRTVDLHGAERLSLRGGRIAEIALYYDVLALADTAGTIFTTASQSR